MPEQDRFVEFYFSPQEIAFINSLSGREKTTAFFRVWTCKEAILKAIGAGLTKEISQTCVSLSSPALPRVLSLDGDMRQAAGWHLELFTPFDGYQGALAIESQDCSVSFHQVDDQLPGFLTE
jgi:4'-phosphopantetheinyl transferase